MSEPDGGQRIDAAFDAVNNANRITENLELDGAPLDDLARASDELRASLVSLLTAVMDEMETLGMAFQDEPWWHEFCALKKKLGETRAP